MERQPKMSATPKPRAIHYWRPFEETPVLKTFSCDTGGRCSDLYQDPEGSRLRGAGVLFH